MGDKILKLLELWVTDRIEKFCLDYFCFPLPLYLGVKGGREGGRKEGRRRGREGGREEGRKEGREEEKGRKGGREEGKTKNVTCHFSKQRMSWPYSHQSLQPPLKVHPEGNSGWRKTGYWP